jgi:hypothetical protein
MSDTIPTAATERVAAGAAWLDVAAPGWVDRIDPGTLDLSSDADCVLGQVFGSFDAGLAVLSDHGKFGIRVARTLAQESLRLDPWNEHGLFESETLMAWLNLMLARNDATRVSA